MAEGNLSTGGPSTEKIEQIAEKKALLLGDGFAPGFSG